ncbi:lipase 3 isoform X1 [Bombyx mori]|uniref:Lipase n=1 Tax=Bombyx mori TaxID=7091 RepID=A0A8R2QUS6_BOMMO|nr:lipase 3-like [Bombyx mori]
MFRYFITTILVFSSNYCYAEISDEIFYRNIQRITDPSILEDARLDTFTLIRKYGYPCEIHRVYTEDGYILEMHRVPNGKYNAKKGPKPVVLLQHGLLSSSAEWVLMTPGKGLAYILAEIGYDVWMGNARGNTYSRHHKSLVATSSEFWKFSWHEIGYYDLPAMIDYVIKETGAPKIQYIGFSQGTTVFWVMTSTRPEYNDKVSAMQALAPVVYLRNVRSPLVKAIAPFTNTLEIIFKLLGKNELLPNGKINELAGQTVCVEEAITQFLCTNLLFLVCGFNEEQLNKTMLPVVMGHTPAGSSTRQFVHFGQIYKSDEFLQFNHGWIKNKFVYGTFRPPAYNLSAIRTPAFLHYADNDWLSTPNDVHRLSRSLKSVVGKFKVPMPEFNHLDFVFAINATNYIYSRLINIMEQFK